MSKNLFQISNCKVTIDTGVSITPENVQAMIEHVQHSPWDSPSSLLITVLVNLKKAVEETLTVGNSRYKFVEYIWAGSTNKLYAIEQLGLDGKWYLMLTGRSKLELRQKMLNANLEIKMPELNGWEITVYSG